MIEIEFLFCLNRTLIGIHVRQWWGRKLKRGRGADDVIWPCADLHWVHMVTQRTRCSAVWDMQKPIRNASLNTGSPLCLRYDAHSVFSSWCASLGGGQKPQQRSPVRTDIPAANVCFSTVFPNKQAYCYFSSRVNRITMKSTQGLMTVSI